MPRPVPGRRAGLASSIALAAAALACSAASAAPAPGCAGLAFTDPSGDAVDDSLLVAEQPASPNLDVLAGFFNDDAGAVTANIQVANLTVDVPATATGVDWYMIWTAG